MATLISNKVNFRAKKVPRDKEGYHLLIKGSIHNKAWQFKVFIHITGVSDYMKQKLKELKKDTCKSMIMFREFDIPLSVTIELVDRNSVRINKN